MKRANCQDCPLNGCKKVPPTLVHNPKLIIVGEAPGKDEERIGRPFVGQSGRLLNVIFQRLGIDRETEIGITNASLCRPKDKLGVKDWRQVLDCCRPRLAANLQEMGSPIILSLGVKALQTLTGKAKLKPWFGSPIPGIEGTTVVPNWHPAFCLRKPSMMPVLGRVTQRALELADGDLSPWKWPYINTSPTYEDMTRLLASPLPIAIDIETAGADVFTADMLCIGCCNREGGFTLQWPPSPDQESALRKILESPKLKVMHNGQHDIIGLDRLGFSINNFRFDTLLAHAVVAPQLPHDLSFVAACEFHAPRWKTEFRVESDLKGSERFVSANMADLLVYNWKDAYMTALLYDKLKNQIDTTHKGQSLFTEYLNLNEVAIKMTKRGVRVNPDCFQEHRIALTEELELTKGNFEKLAPGYQLGRNGAHLCLKELFFEKLGCAPYKYSGDTGQPSLDAYTLEQYVGHQNPHVSNLSIEILKYRKAYKLLSVYVDGMPVNEENLVRPRWKVYGTVTGRWSSQQPNAQNIPKQMRNLFIPRSNKFIVKADFSSLEIRIIALVAGLSKILQWIEEGKDVHDMHLELLIPNSKTWNKTKRKEARNIIKTCTYATAYKGSPQKMWTQLKPNYPDIRLPMVEGIYNGLHKLHPELSKWHRSVLQTAEEQGYTEEVISGRREYFHDGMVMPNKALNFPIQGAAGSIMNRAIIGVDRDLDWETESILFQVHDELDLEMADIDRGAVLLKKHMEQEIVLDGRKMRFPIDVEWGTNWKDLQPYGK